PDSKSPTKRKSVQRGNYLPSSGPEHCKRSFREGRRGTEREIAMMPLEGKTALVTGGSRGIGRAIVQALARAGARVAFVYQSNSAASQAVVDELTSQKLIVSAYREDVRNKPAVDELVGKLVDQWGRLDILVNNAGIIRDTLLATMSRE